LEVLARSEICPPDDAPLAVGISCQWFSVYEKVLMPTSTMDRFDWLVALYFASKGKGEFLTLDKRSARLTD